MINIEKALIQNERFHIFVLSKLITTRGAFVDVVNEEKVTLDITCIPSCAIIRCNTPILHA